MDDVTSEITKRINSKIKEAKAAIRDGRYTDALTSLLMAEKYAHVTFFLNGGIEKPYPGEDRVLIPSPKVATYDLKPEMSAKEVTGEVISKIRDEIYDVIIINYANPDMVGHTGFLDAAIKAIETVDHCVGRVVLEVEKVGGISLITWT